MSSIIMEGLDLNQAEKPKLISAGWHLGTLTDEELIVDEEKMKAYIELTFTLDDKDPDRPGAKQSTRVSYPVKGDDQVTQKDGRTAQGFKLDIISAILKALGGPEKGAISPTVFRKLIGRKAQVQFVHEEYPEGSGDIRSRIPFGFNFGRGIKAA